MASKSSSFANPPWISRLELLFAFMVAFGLFYLLFREASTDAQLIFRQGLIWAGVVGLFGVRLLKWWQRG